MTEETLLQKWKSRKLRKKQEEIEMLRLEIEKAKLEKELENIKNSNIPKTEVDNLNKKVNVLMEKLGK